jgi:hypothetical protein
MFKLQMSRSFSTTVRHILLGSQLIQATKPRKVPKEARCSIEILERVQSKDMHIIVDAPWYVPNTVIPTDLQTPTVKEEIRHYSSQYSGRLSVHPNDLSSEPPGATRQQAIAKALAK